MNPAARTNRGCRIGSSVERRAQPDHLRNWTGSREVSAGDRLAGQRDDIRMDILSEYHSVSGRVVGLDCLAGCSFAARGELRDDRS